MRCPRAKSWPYSKRRPACGNGWSVCVNDRPKSPPAVDGWDAEVEELRLRRAEAMNLGGTEAVAKHHGQGRLTIRERIDGLVDAGSFQEVGGLAGQGRYVDGKLVGVTPAPYVMGLAAIDGR